MTRTLLLFCCFSLLLMGAAFAQSGEDEGLAVEPLVRIGLAQNQSQVTLSLAGGSGTLLDPDSNATLGTAKAGETITLTLKDGQVRWGKHSRTAMRLVPDGSAHVLWSGVPWRGEFELRPLNKGMVVINRCHLDEYLYGVVPGEMPSNWHPEALKSQAVAARTYAVKGLGKYADSHGLFDLLADINDQVYLGMREENPATNRAIDATSGLILTYAGEPIVAYYHSASGESTINGSAMRGAKTDFPYLRGVPSREVKLERWGVQSTVGEFRAKIESRGGYKIGEIIEIGPHPEDSGLIVVRHTEGLLELPRNYIRGFYGQAFRSPNFKIEITPAPEATDRPIASRTALNFVGTGWGHGVGMSQHGAQGYASQEQWSYRQILAHYYTGTELSIWFDMSACEHGDDLFALDH